MRHPAAPTIIAVLFGFLAFMILWGRLRGDGHHEGNPDPRDLPKKNPDGDEDADDHAAAEKEAEGRGEDSNR
jgi:hypothetical protein